MPSQNVVKMAQIRHSGVFRDESVKSDKKILGIFVIFIIIVKISITICTLR